MGTETACGSGGIVISARAAEVVSEPRGGEVYCTAGSTLRMPPTVAARPVAQGHELRVPGGHSLVEVTAAATECEAPPLGGEELSTPASPRATPLPVLPTTTTSDDEEWVVL